MKKASILIIDDEEVMRDSCRQVLLRQGHEIQTADDGASGLDALAGQIEAEEASSQGRIRALAGVDVGLFKDPLA